MSLAVLQASQTGATTVASTPVSTTRCSARDACNPSGDLPFDLVPVAGAHLELPDQTRRALAQARADLGEVLVGDLAHRPIELDFLDRAQDQRRIATISAFGSTLSRVHARSASSGMNSMKRTSYGFWARELGEAQHLVLGEVL